MPHAPSNPRTRPPASGPLLPLGQSDGRAPPPDRPSYGHRPMPGFCRNEASRCVFFFSRGEPPNARRDTTQTIDIALHSRTRRVLGHARQVPELRRGAPLSQSPSANHPPPLPLPRLPSSPPRALPWQRPPLPLPVLSAGHQRHREARPSVVWAPEARGAADPLSQCEWGTGPEGPRPLRALLPRCGRGCCTACNFCLAVSACNKQIDASRNVCKSCIFSFDFPKLFL